MSETSATTYSVNAVTCDQAGTNIRVEFTGGGVPDASRRAVDLLAPHQRARATKHLADQPAFRRLKALRAERETLLAELRTLAAEEPAAATAEARRVLARRRHLAEQRLGTLRTSITCARSEAVEGAVLAMGREYGLPAPLKQRQSEVQQRVAEAVGPALEELVLLAAAERLFGAQTELKAAAEAVLGDDEPQAAPPTDFTVTAGTTVPSAWVRPQ